MNRITGALVLMTGGALLAQDIHFKTRTMRPAVQHVEQKSRVAAKHWIIQFDHSPAVEDLDGLLRDGLQVVASLPDNAVVVTSNAVGVIPSLEGRQWAGRMEPDDKISPEIPTDDVPSFALVEFHSDVTRDQQDAVALAEGLTLQHPGVLRPDHALISGTIDNFHALAAHDEVAYVFPGDPSLLDTGSSLMPCFGMLTSAGAVGQYANIVHGWDVSSDNIAHLGYFFGSITPKVPAATVQSEVVRALNEWAKYTNINYQAAGSATAARTVVVKFVSGAHGDAWPFDGPGGVLAHTFYPVPINSESIAGDMHLDADENWHSGGDIDIYSVALHEAGHAIGLGHSDKPGDVMYPYYQNGRPLSANDIGAAQALYGAVSTPAPISDPPPTVPVPTAPAPAVLRITIDAAPSSTQDSTFSLTGTVTGGTAPWSLQWQTDRGYSGRGSITGNAWIASVIPLSTNGNNITVTAFDAVGRSTSQTISVTYSTAPASPSAGSGPPVSISISSPASAVYTTNASAVTVTGKASGGAGVNRVTWQTAAGATGTAVGTNTWIAQGIPVYAGTNTIVIRAWDEKGASAWSSLVVVRH